MNDTDFARLQVNAAINYINRSSEQYALDRRSCRFWQRLVRDFWR
jgi:hypothetical protein